MKLYLCRHAEAVDDPGPALGDEGRWLTRKGRHQAAKVGKALRHEKERPDLVFTSPLVRAVQTAEGLAHALEFDEAILATAALAPGGQLSQVLDAVAAQAGEDDAVFLVGHEPQMSDWAAALLGSRFPRSFSKGAVLRLDFDGLPGPGQGRAKFFLTAEKLEREKL